MTTGFISEPTTRDFEDKTFFRSIIGSLQFISCHTRPDIAFAVNTLSRRVNNPKVEDWTAVKHLLRYLKGTLDKRLIIRSSNADLDCFVDSSFASELEDKKSVTGMIIKYSESPIVWRSRKQTNVALSTSESEFAALNEIVNEVQWIEQLLIDLNEKFR
ncbi:secreted RxLR effector protein 161-like, partial [Sceloporus undulatus]|uniref:secreted RxLR effector protein 161-like n=1 Tax=Sceloporus undulatus TaxID=8520 RepID=UPI001C4B3DE5